MNSSEGRTVWSSDEDRALAVASAVESETVGINGYIPEPTAPFGAIKQSGIGREFGLEDLASYRRGARRSIQ
ncbi:aldehyde dehydrogenase family protein [Mycolicibacterium stellerae]|uniref:aldehyde dehydrogenase family protein n=1 Tax=Mycolicibacterium stellerae TaxID=2358193 RepID=UPI000F0BA1D0|nr:aldehyde dehydrogenase family protein [Mycolicibacterium stellerae]